ncbi:hypothetical protein AGMMS4956_15750 [Bacteroidia bacterium]|nr:hypothetical protein AGMMS4956_15750 [Bacteroidia bacterium]
MCEYTFLCLDATNWVAVGLSFGATILWSLFLYRFRPRLEIKSFCIGKDDKNRQRAEIKMLNRSCRWDAINIKIEACLVETIGVKTYTYHLELDRNNFLVIPKRDKEGRTFVSYGLTQSAQMFYSNSFDNFVANIIQNEKYHIRVRVHANHPLTGFGKILEKRFAYNETTKCFVEKEGANKNHSKNRKNMKNHTRRRYLLMYLSFIFVSVLFFSSCGVSGVSTTYLSNGYGDKIVTSVNSFGNYNLNGKTFYIESGNQNISSDDVEFREYANYVSISLRLQGAIETQKKKKADMCILINYGISDESYTETIPFPIWGQTGISSINTTSNTSGYASGSAMRIGNSVYGSASGNSRTNTNTSVDYSYGVTGYMPIDRRVTLFRRVLNIYAYDNQRTSEAKMLWKTNLVSDGNSSDLRKRLPYMAYTAWGQMGKSSDGWEKWHTFFNDYYYQCWKDGTLLSSNVVGYPNVQNTNVDDDIRIALVEKKSNETIVVIKKTGCLGGYLISPTTYIEYGGKKYYVQRADGYELGNVIRQECGTRYLRLHFPAIPSSATLIDISECDDAKKGWNCWEWEGVKIR